MFTKVFFLAIVFQVVTGKNRTVVLVKSEVGLIKGFKANDGNYSMFLGIPYGKVDEKNPFSAAVPYPKFENTFKAFSDNIVCPQVEEFNKTIVGTPDCLVLNVYIPSSASFTNSLPILVWIHGGGFRYGDGNRYLYDPGFLMKQNIIVVSINYRLGPYGFMCLETPKVPGNQGLKDQVLALRWIKKNLVAFGGDINRITISGQSAGSMSVGLHLHSNTEKFLTKTKHRKTQLYHQVIIQSGSEKLPLPRRSSKRTPIDIALYLGFPADTVDDALYHLAKFDSHKIIAVVNKLNLTFIPCVEKEFDGVESLITQHWVTSELPKIRNIPILIGFNSDESLWRHISLKDDYYKNFNLRDNLELEFNIDIREFEGMEDIVRHFYFDDEYMSARTRRNIIDFDSDFTFIHPTYRSINKYLSYGAGNIFFYLFSYSGKRNYFRDFFNYTGATHSDELGYLFDISYMKNRPITPEDKIVIDRMTIMWANFVKFGNPTPQTSALFPIKWTPVKNMYQGPYLNIDSQLSLNRTGRPYKQRATFWDLFYRANKRFLKVQNPS